MGCGVELRPGDLGARFVQASHSGSVYGAFTAPYSALTGASHRNRKKSWPQSEHRKRRPTRGARRAVTTFFEGRLAGQISLPTWPPVALMRFFRCFLARSRSSATKAGYRWARTQQSGDPDGPIDAFPCNARKQTLLVGAS